MAGFIDKFLGSMNLYENNEDENEEEQEAVQEEAPVKETAKKFFRRSQENDKEETAEASNDETAASVPVRTSYAAKRNTSVVPIKKAQSKTEGTVRRSDADAEVCMVKPATFDDAKGITDKLQEGRIVIINMEGVHIDLAQRVMDFTFGTCYAIKGNLQKISNYIFIATPNNIELSGDFQRMLGTNVKLMKPGTPGNYKADL